MAEDRLERYPHAMDIDVHTDKPMSKVSAYITGSYVRHSTAPRPVGREGDTLYLWDTKETFISDGTEWRAL